MITSHRSPVKRALAGLAAGALAFSGLALAATPAAAVPGFTFDRLAGPDRYATAADIAIDTFGTAPSVLLASGDDRNFPDSLTGNYLAGDRQDPILLTMPTTLPTVTRTALATLGTRNITILGGTDAVSLAVESNLRASGFTVDRVSGSDRYKTARAIASTPDTATVGITPPSPTNGGGGRTALLASGENFPDALVAGALGYAASFPVEITTPTTLREETRASLVELNIEFVLIIGGTDAVSAAVKAQVEALGISTLRLAGGTRAETAVAVANYAKANLGFVSTHVNLARGDKFPDALTGGPHAGQERAPILLTIEPGNVGAATISFLEANCPTLVNGHIYGGIVAVTVADETAARNAASNCAVANRANVALGDNTIDAGAAATGTITIGMGTTVASVTVSGCGVTNAPLTDTDASAAGFQFSVTIPDTQPTGECTLTFTTTFTDGVVEIDRVAILVNTIEVSPDTATATVALPNPDTSSADDRQFTVAGLVSGQTYRITLVKCENVQGSGSDATFLAATEANSSTGFAADTGRPTADITSVNGVARADTDTTLAGLQVGTTTFVAAAATATFVVDGDTVECVVPVVYFDSTTADPNQGGTGPRLEVAAPTGTATFSAPVESFDIGGETNFTA